jgi:hypothetical protein
MTDIVHSTRQLVEDLKKAGEQSVKIQVDELQRLLEAYDELSDYNYELQSLKILGTFGAGFRAFRAAQPALSEESARALWDKHTENIKRHWERIAEAVVYGVG